MSTMIASAVTDVGRVRDHNEDSHLVDADAQVFIVADGMGGHAAGEVASSITVHKVRDAVYSNRDLLEEFKRDETSVEGVEILQILEHALQSACSTVYQRAQKEQEKRGMGTTASVLLIAGASHRLRGFIAHVGDSRIYLTRQDQCHQLTEDHSLMNELLRRGKLKKEEFENSPYKQFKNAVTRAVGVYPSVEVDTFDFDVLPGDQYLLCSDGMYVYFDEAELPTLLAEGEIAEAPKKLVDRANDGGGHDNITNVVIRVGELKEPTANIEEFSLKIEVLKSMQMFRYLSYKELVRVMNITNTADYGTGVKVFAEGDAGDAMFIVLRGAILMKKDDRVIAELSKGQHFGEMSLVDRSQRSLTAIASEPTRLISILRKDFYAIIKKEPSLAVKLLWSFVQVLADRLRKTTTDLSGVLDGGPSEAGTEESNLFQD